MVMMNYIEEPKQDEIYKSHNITQNEIDEKVVMLKDWLKEQPHLPLEESNLLDQKLRHMLLGNKMSLQKTKDKLDQYYSARTIFSDLYTDREPLKPNIQRQMRVACYAPIKKPYGHTRIVYFKLLDTDIEKWNFLDFMRVSINIMELINIYDSCVNIIGVIDLKNMTMAHAMSFNIQAISTMAKLAEKAYSDRVHAGHYINCPSYFARLVNLMKSMIKEKLANRIHCHEGCEAIQEFIPKEYIPKDYGGDCPSLQEMNDEWIKFVEANNEIIADQINYKSNEKLRPGKPLKDENFGMEGSFRKLELD